MAATHRSQRLLAAQDDRSEAAATTTPLLGTPEFRTAVMRTLAQGSSIIPNSGFADGVMLLLDRPFAPLSISQIADAIGMKSAAFEAQFRECLGTGPTEFLERERLRYASHLLRNGMQPMAEVARLAGFPDYVALSGAFQQHHGVSPSEIYGEATLNLNKNGDF